MPKKLIISFAICTALLTYLAILLFSLPLEKQVDLEHKLPNTKIKLEGTPIEIKYYQKEIRFILNTTEVRVKGVNAINKQQIYVEGYLSEYQGKIWVQALKVKYYD